MKFVECGNYNMTLEQEIFRRKPERALTRREGGTLVMAPRQQGVPSSKGVLGEHKKIAGGLQVATCIVGLRLVSRL